MNIQFTKCVNMQYVRIAAKVILRGHFTCKSMADSYQCIAKTTTIL